MATGEGFTFLGPALIGAASVAGPLHQRHGLPNQDAFAVFYSAETTLILAVADGLGSAPKSHLGSRYAVELAVQVLLEYFGATDFSTAAVKHEILARWLKRCAPGPRDYDTTLLFAGLTRDQCLLGQIGDGLIIYKKTDEDPQCQVFARPDRRFLNEPPSSLAQPSAYDYFHIEKVPDMLGGGPVTTLLMTDGVADDLRDVEVYTNSLVEHLDKLTPQQWGGSLEEHLTRWPTPGHYDDKTIVVTRLPLGKKLPAAAPETLSQTNKILGHGETTG